MEPTDTQFIHPEDFNNLRYWTRKWGVSLHQLNDAILYTGSLKADQIRTYLRKDNYLYHPLLAVRELSQRVNRLFDAEIES